MKISTKGRYGLRILLDLALHDEEKPRMIHQIAESQQISEKYISRLIIDLRRAGMVKSVRGAKGGYRIARKPESITLLEIVEVMEGPLLVVECLASGHECGRSSQCPTREVWMALSKDIRQCMAKIKLSDLIQKARIKDSSSGYFDYCI